MDKRSAGRAGIIIIAIIASLIAGFSAATLWRGGDRAAPGGSPGDASKNLYTCGMHPQVIQEGPGTCPICRMKLTPLRQGAPPSADAGLTIDPVMVQNMGLRTAAASVGPLERIVRAPGFLREAEPAQHDFSLKVGGWVRKLHADTEGMHIRRDTVLLEIYSPDVLAAGAELIAARRSLESLAGEVDPLVRKEAEKLVDASRQKLLLWDIAPQDVDLIAGEPRPPETVLIRSPYEGHLIEKLVVEGSAVKPGEKLFRIVDHSVLWLDAQLYERDLAFVFTGQEARSTVGSMPGRVFSGRVLLIHPHLHEVTRSATARVAVDNPGLVLRPGMYATVVFRTRLEDRVTLVLREAVIDTGVRKIAFIALGEGRFEPREVRTGLETDDGLIQVTEGISPGERVVTSGQFLLDAESRTREAARKFVAEGLQKAAGKPAGKAEAKADPPARAERLDAETRGKLQAPIDDLARSYLELARLLAADDAAGAAGAAKALAAQAASLSRSAEGTAAAPLASALARDAAALEGKPLEEVRRLFRPASDGAIRLLESAPPSRAVAAELSIIHCPMFPGDWIQTGSKVSNPYYGKEMLECGELVRTIRAEGGAP